MSKQTKNLLAMKKIGKFYTVALSIMLLNYSPVFAQEISPKTLKKIKATEIRLDENNGDGVFIARGKKSKKWGMFQAWSENDVTQMIPMQYDSIDFFGFNAEVTGVWNSGKVGIYISPWSFDEDARQTIPCLYDDYKIFNVERTVYDGMGHYKKYVTYVAIKKNNRWAWIDWITGELKTDFIVDLENEKMPYPDFEQKRMM